MPRARGWLAGWGVSLPESGSEPILGAASSLRDEEEPPAGRFLQDLPPPPRPQVLQSLFRGNET